jgi:hypothetical protein
LATINVKPKKKQKFFYCFFLYFSFDEYKSKIYLAANFASHYAMLSQIFNEVCLLTSIIFEKKTLFRLNKENQIFDRLGYLILDQELVLLCGKFLLSILFVFAILI